MHLTLTKTLIHAYTQRERREEVPRAWHYIIKKIELEEKWLHQPTLLCGRHTCTPEDTCLAGPSTQPSIDSEQYPQVEHSYYLIVD